MSGSFQVVSFLTFRSVLFRQTLGNDVGEVRSRVSSLVQLLGFCLVMFIVVSASCVARMVSLVIFRYFLHSSSFATATLLSVAPVPRAPLRVCVQPPAELPVLRD